MINVEKWEAVAKNEDLVKQLFKLGDTESIQAALKENGFEFSAEEVKEMGQVLADLLSKNTEGELNAEDLESVAGGGKYNAGQKVGIALIAVGTAGLVASSAAYW